MLLKNKNAIIYGGAGAIGSAVAKAFAAEGAHVFLAGRTLNKLEAVAYEIKSNAGKADVTVVDATDQQQVKTFLEDIAAKHGNIDISFNAIGMDDMQGNPLTEMKYQDFIQPVDNAMKSYFITAVAAAEFMIRQRSGVILAITANASKMPYENIGSFGVACAAIEGFCRQLAHEIGRHNIRVVCLRSAGSPDAPGVDEVFKKHAANEGVSREAFEKNFAERTMLKRLPLLKEVADAAVLAASDKASAITAAVFNITCGELAD